MQSLSRVSTRLGGLCCASVHAGRFAIRQFAKPRAASSAPHASFKGVYPIVATPFKADESLDLESFKKTIRFLAQSGVEGVTIVGVLGESNRLLDAEREALIRVAVEAAKDFSMPVIVGASHAGTAATRGLSQMAEELGASGVMITPTREPTPLTPDRMVEYFAQSAAGVSIPMVLQDHPASTQVSMSVPLMARIVREVPNVASVKLESLPSPPKIAQLKKLMAEDGRSATILVGLGALYAGFDLEQGIDGFMTGFAFPEALRALIDAQDHKDYGTMMALYRHWLPLIVFEQQPGVAVRKEIYRLRGMLEVGHVRHPAGGLSPNAAAALQRVIANTLPGVDITKTISQDKCWP